MKTITIPATELSDAVTHCRGLRLENRRLVPERPLYPVAAPDSAPDAEPVDWPFGAPVLRALPVGTVNVQLPRRTLRGSYSHGVSRLDSEDVTTLTNDYLNAYRRCVAEAYNMRGYFAPVLARAVVYGRDGRVLYRGAPVLLAPNDVAGLNARQVTRRLLPVGSNYNALEQTPFGGTAFQVAAEWLTEGADDPRLDHVEIQVSPQLHAPDFEGVADIRINRYDSAAATLEMSMPGSRLDSLADLEALVEGSVSVFEQSAPRFCRMKRGSISLSAFAEPSCSANPKEVRSRLLALKPTGLRGLVAGQTSAALQARNGDVVLMGDITYSRRHGISPLEWAATGDDRAWEGSVRIEYADGRDPSVWTFHANWDAPLTLNPFILWPEGDARRIVISVESRRWTLDLTPSRCGTFAYFLNTSLAPIAPNGTGTPETVEHVADIHSPGLILAFREKFLDVPVAVAEVPGSLKAILPAKHANAGLQFGQTPFYLLGSRGIHLARLNASRTAIHISELDSRGVVSPDHVCATPHGPVAIAANCLVCVCGTIVSTIREDIRYDAVGWSGCTGELWVVPASGPTLISRGLKGPWREALFTPAALRTGENALRLTSETGVWLTTVAQGFPRAQTPVEWEAVLDAPPGRRVHTATWNLVASRFQGTLEVCGHEASEATDALPMLSLEVDGPLVNPLVSRVWSVPHSRITLRLAGVASPDFRFSSVNLSFI